MKNVLITGSSTGIGFATAIHLARAQYQVYAGLRTPEKAEQLQAAIDSGLPIQMVQLDVTDDASVTNAVEEVSRTAARIDVLVFSALVPKALGAKIILDLHDPMPELRDRYGLFESGLPFHPSPSQPRASRRSPSRSPACRWIRTMRSA